MPGHRVRRLTVVTAWAATRLDADAQHRRGAVAGARGQPEDRRLDRPPGLGLGRGPGGPDHPPARVDGGLPHAARPVGRPQPERDRPPRRARRWARRTWPTAPASSCTPSPSSTPAAGTLSLRADEIRQVGLGELLARLEQLKKLLAAEGLFDPRAQAAAAVPAGPDRADHRPGQRRRAGRADERRAPLAGGRLPGHQRRGAGRRGGAADHRRARRARQGPQRST